MFAPAAHDLSAGGGGALPAPVRPPYPSVHVLTPGEAAAALGLAVQTLARWRCEGFGPKFVRVGGRVGYRLADIEAWLAGRVASSTSQRVA